MNPLPAPSGYFDTARYVYIPHQVVNYLPFQPPAFLMPPPPTVDTYRNQYHFHPNLQQASMFVHPGETILTNVGKTLYQTLIAFMGAK